MHNVESALMQQMTAVNQDIDLVGCIIVQTSDIVYLGGCALILSRQFYCSLVHFIHRTHFHAEKVVGSFPTRTDYMHGIKCMQWIKAFAKCIAANIII